MKNAILLLVTALSMSATALENKEFTCKNGHPDLPANTYKITHTDIAGGPNGVPFVEIQRHFKGAGGVHSTSEIKGFATHSTSGETEYLMLGQLTLEFRNGELINCRPVNSNN